MALSTDPLFIAVTRPAQLWGVPVSGLLINGLICMEGFLLTHSFWAMTMAPLLHYGQWLAVRQEPRLFELLSLHLTLAFLLKKRPFCARRATCLAPMSVRRHWPVVQDLGNP
jgi:type IV secretory pathway VirB3-like protein